MSNSSVHIRPLQLIISEEATVTTSSLCGSSSLIVLQNQANSSQVTKSKLASAGGQTIPPSRASSRKPIVWIRPRGHTTIKKNLAGVGLNWPRWPNGGNLNLSLIKFKPTRASSWSSQVVGQTVYPAPSKSWTWIEVAWELGVPFGQGLTSKSTFFQPFQEKCIREVVRTGTIIIFQSE